MAIVPLLYLLLMCNADDLAENGLQSGTPKRCPQTERRCARIHLPAGLIDVRLPSNRSYRADSGA
jgi:hypothetical protein